MLYCLSNQRGGSISQRLFDRRDRCSNVKGQRIADRSTEEISILLRQAQRGVSEPTLSSFEHPPPGPPCTKTTAGTRQLIAPQTSKMTTHPAHRLPCRMLPNISHVDHLP